MIAIDYRKLAAAQEYYSGLGYIHIDAPWWATENIVRVTAPAEIDLPYHFDHSKKVLVGSAEQSFLYLAAKGLLPAGRYVAITPCFRHEIQDALHRKTFMKAELINTIDPHEESLHRMIEEARVFFSSYLPESLLRIEETPAYKADVNFDITIDGFELGSYGIRRSDFLTWVYGTGCAEPRLSTVMKAVSARSVTLPEM